MAGVSESLGVSPEPAGMERRLISMRSITLPLVALILVTACGGAGSPANDLALPPDTVPTDTLPPETVPAPGEALPPTGPFFVEEASFRVAESFPIQVFLDVAGNQPTPCDEASWTVERVAGTVQVELYTVANPAATCMAVLQPVDLVIPLGAFESGTWTVLLNGEDIGTFEA